MKTESKWISFKVFNFLRPTRWLCFCCWMLVYINPLFHSIDCAIISTFVFLLRSSITFCGAVSREKNFHKTRLFWTMSQQTTFFLHFFSWLSPCCWKYQNNISRFSSFLVVVDAKVVWLTGNWDGKQDSTFRVSD